MSLPDLVLQSFPLQDFFFGEEKSESIPLKITNNKMSAFDIYLESYQFNNDLKQL